MRVRAREEVICRSIDGEAGVSTAAARCGGSATTPKTGQHVCESTKIKDGPGARKAARDKLDAKIGQRAEGRLVVGADRVAFDELATDLLNEYKRNNRKSLADARRRVAKHLTPFFKGRRAQEISTADIDAYVVRRQASEASNGTINRELAALKRMFNLALRAGKIVRKPYVPMLKEQNARQGFFEQEQFERLLANSPEWFRPPLTFAYLTGWRLRSEIFPLRWSNVDLATGTVRLDPGTTKNGEGRLIYLTDELQALLSAQWEQHATLFPDCPFVFHRSGKQIRSAYRAWRKACRAAKITGSIPHDFRRTAVRRMVRRGLSERVAMDIAGHKTRSVFDRYNIVAESDLRDAAKRLSGALGSGTATVLATLSPNGAEQSIVTH